MFNIFKKETDSIWQPRYIDEATFDNNKFEGKIQYSDAGSGAWFITKAKYRNLITSNILKCKGYEFKIVDIFNLPNDEIEVSLK